MKNLLLFRTNFVDFAYAPPKPDGFPPYALDENIMNQSDIVWRLPDDSLRIWDLGAGGADVHSYILYDSYGTPFGRGGYPGTPQIYTRPGPDWTATGSGHFFEDGSADLLWRHTDGHLVLWDIAIANRYVVNAPGYWHDIAPVSGQILMDPDGAILQPGPEWSIIGTCDLTGDGRTDVLLRNSDERLSLWAMNGSRAIYTAGLLDWRGVEVKPNALWSLSGTIDFNGDRQDDLLWHHEDGTTVIWTMNANIVTASGQLVDAKGDLFLVSPAWTITGVGDFNGDGFGDIVWRGPNHEVALSFMHGTVVEEWRPVLDWNLNPVLPGDEWSFTTIGDYNADGVSDIFLRSTQNDVSIWLMNSAAVVTSVALSDYRDPLFNVDWVPVV